MNEVNINAEIVNINSNKGASRYIVSILSGGRMYIKKGAIAIVIAQYSFPMNTESDTHGLRRSNVFLHMLKSCPFIAGLYPEQTVDLNSQKVAMVGAQYGSLIDCGGFEREDQLFAKYCRLAMMEKYVHR